MTKYHIKETASLAQYHTFVTNSDLEDLSCDSPALSVLTDFYQRKPLMVEYDVSVQGCMRLMQKTHVGLLLVVDKDENFKGIISMELLESRKVLKIANIKDMTISELTISDVMVTKESLHSMTYQSIVNAHIGDIVETMKSLGERYLMIVDRDPHAIRGLISASDIAYMLHAPIDIISRTETFSDVFKILHN